MGGPLEGVKVMDIAQAAAGPVAAEMLAEMGADVLKIEPPWGDFVRNRPPHKNGVDLMVSAYSRSKRSVILDFKKQRDREIGYDLAKWADVFVENYKVGTADKMGFGYEALSKINPRLIYCSVAGFGHYGPLRDRGTMAQIAAAFAGWGSFSGPPGGRTSLPRAGLSPDTATPLYTCFAITSALYYREMTGKGQKIECSQTEAGLSYLQTLATEYVVSGNQPQAMGSATASIVPSQVFNTQDGQLAVEAPTDRTWARLCEAIGEPDLAQDLSFATNPLRVENRASLTPKLEAIFLAKPTAHWVSVLQKHRVPCSELARDLDDLYADPQVQSNVLVTEMELARAGKLKTTCVPWEFSQTPAKIKSLAPFLGEHTEEVLAQFGYTPSETVDPEVARAARLGRK